MTEAYKEGWVAWERSLDFEENPYDQGTEEYSDWVQGYEDARDCL